MKSFLKLFSIAAIIVSACGCDDIDSDNRYVYVEPVEPARKVLLEDFTGQNCVNCPDAHNIINLLAAQYPGSIVSVAIHGGDFAISNTTTDFGTNYIGLGSSDGDALTRKFGIDKWPSGLINRRGGIKSFDQWATLVKDAISLESNLSIEIEPSCDNDSVYAIITLLPQADISGRVNIWLVENNIIARQRSTSGNIRDYVHNHVLRACITDIDGEEISLSSGIHKQINCSIALRYNEHERWATKNLAIVAFVEGDNGVEQAELADVDDNSEE